MNGRGHFVGGRWLRGEGTAFVSHDPSTGEACWEGREATPAEIDHAVTTARRAHEAWSRVPLGTRIERLEAFADLLEKRGGSVAEAIRIELGKPPREAAAEVASMIAKVPATLRALGERRAPAERDLGEARGVVTYRPLGVLAVFGPFNMPAHLPNGHVVPAVLSGNAVVMKASEKAPLVAERVAELWDAAGFPPGVVNLVQGGRTTGEALARHAGIDGILFTGSLAGGTALSHVLAPTPEKILALEMGGNNPLVVHEPADPDAAAVLTIQSAFVTTGQRCTCARRLVVPEGAAGDDFVDRLAAMIPRIRIGPPDRLPEPFSGPLVDPEAARRVLDAQAALVASGAREIVPVEPTGDGPAFLRPGLLDATGVHPREDGEVFGPLLQLVRVRDIDAAIEEANATAFGLVAALFSPDRPLFERFRNAVRAGIVNWNRPTTGASGELPFGGLGRSGNHRPAGFFAIDSTSDPVASLEAEDLRSPDGARDWFRE